MSDTTISITYAKQIMKDDYAPATLEYTVKADAWVAAKVWTKRLLSLAYGDAQPFKRLLILINPFGGKGYAKSLYTEYAAPIFEAARCKLDVETTRHAGHATEIAEQLDIDAYDAVVCCSGDGLPHEVLNGLAKKPNAGEALAKVAVAMLPRGSGNALAWNTFGTNSVSLVALSIVKGLRTAVDLASVTQADSSSRRLSFLSQSYGIVAESDLGTDHLRWMGAARFTYGLLVRLMGKTLYPCDLALKVEIDDKTKIKEHYRVYKAQRPPQRPVGGGDIQSRELPPLRYGTTRDKIPDDWQQISSDTMGNFYAGNMAIMSADANFFPSALPNDGLMDVVTIDGTIGRLKALTMLKAVETGGFYDYDDVVVRKVSAYRLTPRMSSKGFISVDGESLPFEPFQVEVHRGLGTTLTRSGHLYEAKGP